MICNKIKECAEKTRHIQISEKDNKKNKGKKNNRKKTDQEAVYKFPLSKPPCGNTECQDRCIGFLDRRPKPKCEERGKAYTLDQSDNYPRHEVMMFHMDGGIISNPGANAVRKCDYVLLVKDSGAPDGNGGTVVLIELKGQAINQALNQIGETLKLKEMQPLLDSQKRVFGRIVCRSTPPRIRNTDEFLDVQEAFMRRNGQLKIFEESAVEKYADLGKS